MIDTFTSTGAKFFAHEEAMRSLRNGKGQCITTHVMLTDVCQHTCAFCSVQARAGDTLPFDTITSYLAILQGYGLKAVILSGGGNPILYKCPTSGKNFNDVVDAIHSRGLEIGLITNGMPLRRFEYAIPEDPAYRTYRESWAAVRPTTLDKLTWVRISMSGLDHDEQEVYVPDFYEGCGPTLGFSYVAHDIYIEEADPHHGKVSRQTDLISGDLLRRPTQSFVARMPRLLEQLTHYARTYKPRYLRLLPNCLEPDRIPWRCKQLQNMADVINCEVGAEVAFVQHKPPKAPRACYLGYIHPVLNCACGRGAGRPTFALRRHSAQTVSAMKTNQHVCSLDVTPPF